MIDNLESFQDELAASGFPPLVDKLAGDGFRGRIATSSLGPLRLVALDTPESSSIGRERDALDGENLAVKVTIRGRTRIEQGRHGEAELGPTDLVLLDPTRALRFESTAAAHVTQRRNEADDRPLLSPRDGARLRGSRRGGRSAQASPV